MKLQIPEGDFEGFIFDCDGTLADTMPLHYEAWVTVLHEYGATFCIEKFYQLGGTKARQVAEIIAKEQDLALPVEEVVGRKELYFQQRLKTIKPIVATVEFLHSAHTKYPVAVASGGLKSIVISTLTHIGVLDIVDAVVAAEDVVHGKPAPDIFLLAAERIGVNPQKCLVFEDTPTGIQAAIAAQMHYVLVPSAPKEILT